MRCGAPRALPVAPATTPRVGRHPAHPRVSAPPCRPRPKAVAQWRGRRPRDFFSCWVLGFWCRILSRLMLTTTAGPHSLDSEGSWSGGKAGVKGGGCTQGGSVWEAGLGSSPARMVQRGMSGIAGLRSPPRPRQAPWTETGWMAGGARARRPCRAHRPASRPCRSLLPTRQGRSTSTAAPPGRGTSVQRPLRAPRRDPAQWPTSGVEGSSHNLLAGRRPSRRRRDVSPTRGVSDGTAKPNRLWDHFTNRVIVRISSLIFLAPSRLRMASLTHALMWPFMICSDT